MQLESCLKKYPAPDKSSGVNGGKNMWNVPYAKENLRIQNRAITVQ